MGVTTASLNWEDVLRQVQELPTMPPVAALVLPTVEQPDLSIPALESVVLQDPALTAKVMRLANSTLFGAAGRITTMSHALSCMDIYAARLITLSFHLEPSADSRRDCPLFAIWRESRAISILTNLFARRFWDVNLDEAKVAGILANLGELVLAQIAADGDQKNNPAPRSYAGGHTGGVDPAQVAGMLFARWQFPSRLVDPIQAHRQPKAIETLPDQPRELAKVLHLAELFADALLHNNDEKLRIGAALAEVWARIDAPALDGILAEAKTELEQQHLEERDTTYLAEDLLSQAKKQMVQVSLVTAKNLMEAARKVERNRQQLDDLQNERNRLAQQVTTDPLTDIGNRKYFDMRLGEEVNRCKRKRSALSLVLFDLDHFKRLNDTFGHQAGDMVLRSAAREIKKAMRTTDVVARYGGEEFAIIAPGTDRDGAIASAERMRACLENVSVLYNGRRLQVTASFGVVTVVNPDELRSPEQLVELTDACLYEAKRAGRNCVRSAVLGELEDTSAKQRAADINVSGAGAADINVSGAGAADHISGASAADMDIGGEI